MKKILLSLLCGAAALSVKAQQTITVTNTTGCTLDIWADAYDPFGTCPGCVHPTKVTVIGGSAVISAGDFLPAGSPDGPNWYFHVLNVRTHTPGGTDEGCYVGDPTFPFFHPITCSFTGCGPTVNVAWGTVTGGVTGTVPVTIN